MGREREAGKYVGRQGERERGKKGFREAERERGGGRGSKEAGIEGETGREEGERQEVR